MIKSILGNLALLFVTLTATLYSELTWPQAIQCNGQVELSEQNAITCITQLSAEPTTDLLIQNIISLSAQGGSTSTVRQQYAMSALIQLGHSQISDAFVLQVLDTEGVMEPGFYVGLLDNQPTQSVAGALAYMSARSYQGSEIYAEKYIAPSYSLEIRAMAASLAGMRKINTEEMINAIKQVINSTSDESYVRLQALYGLSHLLPVSDFNSFLATTDFNDWQKGLSKRLNRFIQADSQVKSSMYAELLRNSEVILPLAVVNHMLETSDFEALRAYIGLGRGNTSVSIPFETYRLYLKILGYELLSDANNVNVIRRVRNGFLLDVIQG